MKIILATFVIFLFVISLFAHIFVRFRLKPKDPDLDDYYYEFEDQHPEYARYLKYTRITFACIVISALLLFIAAVF
ncbi:MAG: hypothetical protein ACYSSI_10720 [Planctomycetota bacterium]|jgi:hypothetical protein